MSLAHFIALSQALIWLIDPCSSPYARVSKSYLATFNLPQFAPPAVQMLATDDIPLSMTASLVVRLKGSNVTFHFLETLVRTQGRKQKSL